MRSLLLSTLLIVSNIALPQKKSLAVSSPNGQIVFSLTITDTAAVYNVSFKKTRLISNSSLGLDFLESGEFKRRLTAGKPIYREGEENYELITGKTRSEERRVGKEC